MPRWTPINLLKQQCFWFSGEHFGGAQESLKIYHALCGDPTIHSHQTLKENGLATALELFQICIRHDTLFDVFRHNIETAFKIVNDEWESYIDLTPSETLQIVAAYVKARQAYVGQRERTELAETVDRFMITWDRVTEQARSEASEPGFKPPQQLQLSLRPLPSDAATTSTNDSRLISAGSDGSSAAEAPWPPAIFSPEELRFLTDSRIRNDIVGISLPNRPSYINVPNHRTPAIDIKKFLCVVGLIYCNPPKNSFALFMTPIAFLDSRDRNHAFQERKGKTNPRIYGTVDEFMSFARAMINEEARQMVVGLLTNETHTVGNVLVLRQQDGDRGVQLILFDPSQLARTGLQMSEYQAAVMDRIGGPSAGISEAWWGGFRTDEPVKAIDPIVVASDIIHGLVSKPFFLPTSGEGQDTAMKAAGFHKLAAQQ